MRNRKIVLPLFGLIVLGLFVSGCKRNQKRTVSAEKPGQIAASGELNVLSVTPQGIASGRGDVEAVVVMFDRPMVALEALPDGKGMPILRFNPTFSGKTRWLGSRILTFTPDRLFPFSTEIEVTVPAGTAALDGSTLKMDHTWNFQTPAPRLIRHYPQDKQKWLKLDTRVLLLFNQDMDRKSAKEFISLVSVDEQGSEKRQDFRLSYPSAERLKEEDLEIRPETALLLEPKDRLSPGFRYLVEVRKGLPSREGPVLMEKSTLFSFATFRRFFFEGLEGKDVLMPSEQFQFKFSNPVSYRGLVQHLRFEPPLQIPEYYGEWDYSNDVLYLSLPLVPETRYTATIDPGLKDDFGNSMGNEVRVEFSTASFAPSVSMTTGFGVLEASGEARYPLSVLNVESAFCQEARLKKDEVIPLLLQPKIFWSDQKFSPRPGLFQF